MTSCRFRSFRWSVYNLLSDCGASGLSLDEAQQVIDKMVVVVRGWSGWFEKHQVEERSIEKFTGAFLPECFFRKEPISAP
jgi:hypothetical protein